MELADRVVVMNQGRIEQIGTPDEVFHSPSTHFVVNFLGQVNRFHGRVQDGKVHFATLAWESPEEITAESGPAQIFVRPHDFMIATTPDSRPHFRARVSRIHSAGPAVRLELLAESGEQLWAEVSQEQWRRLDVAHGSEVYVTPRDVKIFSSDTA